MLTPFVVAIFVPREMTVEREVRIERPRNEVFAYIRMLKNQEKYAVWNLMDPAMKKERRGVDGQPGAVYGWDSTHEKVGAGEQEIKAVDEGRRIDYELRFKRPFEAVNQAYMITETAGTATIVKWGFRGYMVYPLNLWFRLDGERNIRTAFDTGLFNMKKEIEKRR